MGTVLAMKRVTVLLLATLGCCSIFLSACGSQEVQPIRQTISLFATQLKSGGAKPADVRAQLTPAVVASVVQPFLLVEVPQTKAIATMALFYRRGNVEDWRDAEGAGLVLKDNILTATRGLGADLHDAQVSGLEGALAAGGGTTERLYRRLDGENRIIQAQYACVVSSMFELEQVDLIAKKIAAQRMVETCSPANHEGLSIQNEYWLDVADRKIWKSRQWLNEQSGYVVITHLVR
jgi:hypothetical protein